MLPNGMNMHEKSLSRICTKPKMALESRPWCIEYHRVTYIQNLENFHRELHWESKVKWRMSSKNNIFLSFCSYRDFWLRLKEWMSSKGGNWQIGREAEEEGDRESVWFLQVRWFIVHLIALNSLFTSKLSPNECHKIRKVLYIWVVVDAKLVQTEKIELANRKCI